MGRAEDRRRARQMRHEASAGRGFEPFASLSAEQAREAVRRSGDGHHAVTSTGMSQPARPSRELPPKQPGVHRWIATACYVLSDEAMSHAGDDTPKYMDNENLMDVSFGCWDCEKPYGVIQPGSTCTARPPYAN